MNPTFSLYLHLLRAMAAMAVYLFHAKHFAGVAIPGISDYGSAAVMIFFVLSGVLIAYSVPRHSDATGYALARLARLWSVAIPALILTLVVDVAGQAIDLASYAPLQPYSPFKWVASIVANAAFLNQVWHLNIYPGTNGPFWSLSYEFWYYMIFGALVYFRGWRRIAAVGVCCAIAGPKILVALPIWLIGVVVYHAITRGPQLSERAGAAFWLATLAVGAAIAVFNVHLALTALFPEAAARAAQQWRVNFWPSSYLIGAVIGINIYAFAMTRNLLSDWLAPWGGALKGFADLSFGLYIFHYPLMYFVRACLVAAGLKDGAGYVLAVYLLPFAIAAVLAHWCEANKHLTTRLLERIARRAGYVKPARPAMAPLTDSRVA